VECLPQLAARLSSHHCGAASGAARGTAGAEARRSRARTLQWGGWGTRGRPQALRPLTCPEQQQRQAEAGGHWRAPGRVPAGRRAGAVGCLGAVGPRWAGAMGQRRARVASAPHLPSMRVMLSAYMHQGQAAPMHARLPSCGQSAPGGRSAAAGSAARPAGEWGAHLMAGPVRRHPLALLHWLLGVAVCSGLGCHQSMLRSLALLGSLGWVRGSAIAASFWPVSRPRPGVCPMLLRA
jgi:hypothetical protein